MQILKADTEIKVVIGPFVDVGDGFTPETGITLGAADEAELIKHNAASVTDISGNTWAAITSCDGWYNLTLTTGNLDTEGMLTVVVQDDSVCLPVHARFMVVNANVYDSLYAAAATDYLQVDTTQVGGDTQSATDLKDFADAGYDPATNKVQGVVLTDTCTTNSDMVGTDNAALASVCTEARLAELDAANIPTDLSNIETDTQDLQTQIGTAGAGLSSLGGMSATMKAQVQGECDDAMLGRKLDHLMDAAVTGTDIADNSVIAKLVSKSAIADWDSYSNTTDSLEAIRDKQTDIETDTQDLQTQVGTAGAGLTGLGGMSAGMKAEVNAECDTALTDYDPPTKAELDTAHSTTDALINGLNDVSTAEVNAEVDTALSDIGLDHLLGAAVTGADVTDNSVIAKLASKSVTADWDTYDNQTDSLEAVRDRGDAAWTTGGGASITDILNVQPLIPNDIDLANTATVRLGLALTNALDDLPSTVEITPGTITIDRKAIGGTSWTNVVNAAACSEAAGLVYYDEVFDSGTGYAEGDSIRITFKSQKITVAVNDYEVTGTDGMMFQTSIRQTMRGTDSAALASVCTEARLAELDAANLPTTTDGIKTVTDNLPNSGALTDIDTGVNNIEAKLPTNYIMGSSVQTDKDDEIDAIKAKTDNLPADPADDSDIDGQLSTITTHLTDIKGTGFAKDTHSMPQCLTAAGFSTHSAADVADAVWNEASTGHTDAGKAGAQLWTDIDAILADTNELQTNQGNWATATTVDLNADQSGVTVGTVNSLTGHTAQTGDNYARLGAPAGASVSADVAAIKAETANILTDTAEIGAAGAGLTDLGGMSTTMKGQVQTETNDALVANNLDHLMKTAVANNADMTTEVADGTVLSNIMSKTSDTSSYAVGDDSLEAIADASSGNVTQIMGTSLTETNAGDLANNVSQFFDVNPTTTKDVDDVGAVASGGVPRME